MAYLDCFILTWYRVPSCLKAKKCVVSSGKGTCWFLGYKTQNLSLKDFFFYVPLPLLPDEFEFFYLLQYETASEAVPAWVCEQGKRWDTHFGGSAALCWYMV